MKTQQSIALLAAAIPLAIVAFVIAFVMSGPRPQPITGRQRCHSGPARRPWRGGAV